MTGSPADNVVALTGNTVAALNERRHGISYTDPVVTRLSEMEREYQSLIENPQLASDQERNRASLKAVLNILRVDETIGSTIIKTIRLADSSFQISTGPLFPSKISYVQDLAEGSNDFS